MSPALFTSLLAAAGPGLDFDLHPALSSPTLETSVRAPETRESPPPVDRRGRPIPRTLSQTPEPPRRDTGARIVRWTGFGMSLGLAGVGAGLWVDAQSTYDGAAGDLRFTSSTLSAREADMLRGDARSRADVGAALLVTGLTLAAGALVWELVAEAGR